MKTLCLYYSRTNLTKEVMESMAQVLDADLAEYTDGKDRSGFLGYVGACFATVRSTLPYVSIRGEIDLKAYDRVLIGMPIWAEGPCAIGRALLTKYRDSLPAEVYFVITHMSGQSYEKKIRKMDHLLARPASGYFSVQTKENDYRKESVEYAKTLI